MNVHRSQVRLLHRHRAVRMRVIIQRGGVPYEVERTVCEECERVLRERWLRRAAA